jgi:hypothetical protein
MPNKEKRGETACNLELPRFMLSVASAIEVGNDDASTDSDYLDG